jgi:branched-chain amino acid transport system substrate-binding protein
LRELAKLGTTDFTPHITKTLSAQPDLLITSVWGGDYVAFRSRRCVTACSRKMKVATTVAFAVAPRHRRGPS